MPAGRSSASGGDQSLGAGGGRIRGRVAVIVPRNGSVGAGEELLAAPRVGQIVRVVLGFGDFEGAVGQTLGLLGDHGQLVQCPLMAGRGEISALLVAGGLGGGDFAEDGDLARGRDCGGGGEASAVRVAGPGDVESAAQGERAIDAGAVGHHALDVRVLEENERNGIARGGRVVAIVLNPRCVVLQSHGISRK